MRLQWRVPFGGECCRSCDARRTTPIRPIECFYHIEFTISHSARSSNSYTYKPSIDPQDQAKGAHAKQKRRINLNDDSHQWNLKGLWVMAEARILETTKAATSTSTTLTRGLHCWTTSESLNKQLEGRLGNKCSIVNLLRLRKWQMQSKTHKQTGSSNFVRC